MDALDLIVLILSFAIFAKIAIRAKMNGIRAKRLARVEEERKRVRSAKIRARRKVKRNEIVCKKLMNEYMALE